MLKIIYDRTSEVLSSTDHQVLGVIVMAEEAGLQLFPSGKEG